MNQSEINAEIDIYLAEKRAKAKGKLFLSLVLLIGGALGMALANEKFQIFGILCNLLGFVGMASFILFDKEYLFPRKQSQTEK